jgi:SAM-dependent methyltransferase
VSQRDVYGKPPPHSRPLEEQVVSRRSLLRIPRGGTAAAEIDFEAAHTRVLEGWDAGPHLELLRALEPAADVLVELGEVEAGDTVLDVGAGDGNVALRAAAAGAEVEACDLSPAMIGRGRNRSEGAGADIGWLVADAQDLPYGDESFDAVLSSFGASYAPRALRTARELVRVVRPGGLVALSAWVPRGLPGRLDELVEDVEPLPDGVLWPSAWGREAAVRRRLGPLLEDLELRTRTLRMSWASPTRAFEVLTAPYWLDEYKQAALRPAFDRLLASCNDRPPEVELNARYLIVTGRRPV